MPRTQNSKEIILDAAEQVVINAGAGNLTLDAVAAAAGVSKGGLLYNFPTKEALLQGLVERLHQQFDQALQAAITEFEGEPGGQLKAYVVAALRGKKEMKRVCAAMLAAGANNPQLLSPAREYNRARFSRLADNPDTFARAMIVVLATHGLWLMNLLETSPFSKAQQDLICRELMQLAEKTGK
jgi:AcrR family transcriptional regulator